MTASRTSAIAFFDNGFNVVTARSMRARAPLSRLQPDNDVCTTQRQEIERERGKYPIQNDDTSIDHRVWP